MTATISLDRTADLSPLEQFDLTALSNAVYPHDEWRDWPGWKIDWAGPQWSVRAFDEHGDLVSHVGVVVRDGSVNRRPTRIGGIGSVKTHPLARKRGHATQAMKRAFDFLGERTDVDFVLLVCEDRMTEFYARLGFAKFTGQLHVTQYGQAAVFTFLGAMTRAVKSTAPTDGVVDLAGPIW